MTAALIFRLLLRLLAAPYDLRTALNQAFSFRYFLVIFFRHAGFLGRRTT
jgi:hypothetical protein